MTRTELPRRSFWRWFWGEFYRTARPSLDSWGRTVRFILVLAVATVCTGYIISKLAGSGMSSIEQVTRVLGRLL